MKTKPLDWNIDMIDNPKMICLPDKLWRRTLELFILAKEEGGSLPDLKTATWMLRLGDVDALERDLEEIAQLSDVIRKENGKWSIDAKVIDEEEQSYWESVAKKTIYNPDIALLSDRLWRRAMELFLLSIREQRLVFQDTESIAWLLRIDNLEELKSELRVIELKTWLVQWRNGAWFVYAYYFLIEN